MDRGSRRVLPLTGRGDELAHLLSSLEDTNEVRHTVITGEAGVGKTRLAAEAAAAMADRGWTCHQFAARPGGSSVPFFTFASLLAESDAAGELVDRFVRAGLRLTSGGTTAVLVTVDDCQWLEDVSAAFVCYLAGATKVHLILTRRSGTGLPPALTSLIREPNFGRVELFRLARPEMTDLLGSVLGGRLSESLVTRMWEVTQGNPMYLSQLVSFGVDSGALEPKDGQWVLTGPLGDLVPGVEASVELALGTLDAPERDVVEQIAINGSLGMTHVERLGPRGVLDSLERRGVVTSRVTGQRTEVVLAHPLFDEVLLRQLGPIGRRSRQRQVFEMLMAAGHQRRLSDRLTMAAWADDLGIAVEPPVLIALARDLIETFRDALYPRGPAAATSRRAVGQADHLDLAARLASRAESAGGGFAALEVLHTAATLLGHLQEAEDVLARMRAVAEGVDERIAVLRLVADRAAYDGDRAASAAAIDEAAELARSGPLEDVIRADAAAQRLVTGPLSEAVELARSVVDTPGVAPAAAAQAGFVLVAGLCLQGRPVSALEFLDDESRQLPASETPLRSGTLIFARSMALAGEGDFAGAEAALRQGLVLAETFGHLAGIGVFASGLGHVILDQGRLEEAVAAFDRAVHALDHLDPLCFRPAALGGLARAYALQGRADAAAAATEEMNAGRPTLDVFTTGPIRAEAWTALLSGRRDEAIRMLRHHVQVSLERGTKLAALLAAMDVVRMGDVDAAGLMGIASESFEGRLAVCFTEFARAMVAEDPQLLESVSRNLETLGTTLIAAEVAVLAAEAHVARGRPGRAEACLARSRSLAASCQGADTPILARRVLHLDAFRHLTVREREVASLAAKGLSDRAITDRLHISLRTVENHLHRVYAKLGVSSRGELSELADLAPEKLGAEQ